MTRVAELGDDVPEALDPLAEIPEPPDTNPNGRVSNSDLLDYLKASDKKREEASGARHKTVIDKLTALEGRVDIHDERLTRVERNAFPVLVLWVIALVLGVGVYVNYWHANSR